MDNLISICKHCHSELHSLDKLTAGRKEWRVFVAELLLESARYKTGCKKNNLSYTNPVKSETPATWRTPDTTIRF